MGESAISSSQEGFHYPGERNKGAKSLPKGNELLSQIFLSSQQIGPPFVYALFLNVKNFL